jgi:transmembrane sensor
METQDNNTMDKILNEMKEIEKYDANLAWDKLYNRFENDNLITGTGDRKIKLHWQYLAMAASFLLLIASSITWIYLKNDHSNYTFANVSAEHIQTISLSDGSVISLNTGAKIIYPEVFNDTIRKVKLLGEAYFQVAKNPNCPFVIETEMGRIRVLGTSFNVEMQSNQLLVTVSTGKVQLAAINQLQNKVIVVPGETAVTNGISVKKTVTTNPNYLCWLNKKMEFRSVPLSSVIKDIEKAYQIEIKTNGIATDSLLLTAIFDDVPVDNVLSAISLTFNLKYNFENEKSIIFHY